jgi:IS30 family transposase
MAKAYPHLTYGLRYKISALSESGTSQREIARIVKCNQSTVSRELRRNASEKEYHPEEAHEKAVLRRHDASSVNKKLTPEIAVFIEAKLKEQWSPEQISGRMKDMCGIKISHARIYQYIDEDKKNGGTLYKNLRRRGKKYVKRKGKTAGRGVIPNRIGIEERPEIVDTYERFGDLEIDTIVGAGHKMAILSIVDRKLRCEAVEKSCFLFMERNHPYHGVIL